MQKYDKFIELLLKYNKTHKLTGSKNKDEVMLHIKDSIYVEKFLDFSKIKRAIDIGTGAGFPGMILAMERPNISFTLVEPLMKRAAFLHLIKSEYDLKNVEIVQDRIENIEPFGIDLITSRAVTNSQLLLDLSKGFISKGTKIVLYKGSSVEDELPKGREYKIFNHGNRNYLLIEG